VSVNEIAQTLKILQM